MKGKKDKINIRLIISDEDTNTIDYSIFETYKIKKIGLNDYNRVH